MSDSKQGLSWSNVNDQASELGIGTGGAFFQIEEGENVVRFLSEPVHYSVYFIGKGIKPIFARNADDEIKAKHKPTHRFACHVFNQKTKKVQIAELGYSIVKQIGDFAKSSQYGYEGIPPYDVIITKKGSGMQTEYQVIPGMNKDEIPEEAKKKLAEMESIDVWLESKKAQQAGEDSNPNATEEEKEAEAKKKA